ncbi:MAG: DUF309 domain-containing protein [Desulfobulbaceae bacterium]|nr:DUF309 domain-containing protein [Desulfobulbaceae bacterium]
MDSFVSAKKVERFDPFQSRLCRDVRNDLSENLMDAICRKKIAPCLEVAGKYSYPGIFPVIKEYINDRITRYEVIIDQINAANFKPDNVFEIALLLWDQGLFFEVHEWLEQKWLTSQGAEKMVLQALIRAAGTYVHLQYGRPGGAKKMAAKAVDTLVKFPKDIPDFFNVQTLVAHLAKLDTRPPKLGAEELVKKCDYH